MAAAATAALAAATAAAVTAAAAAIAAAQVAEVDVCLARMRGEGRRTSRMTCGWPMAKTWQRVRRENRPLPP